MKKTTIDKQLQNRAALQRAIHNPVLFARRILGVKLWWGQKEILESAKANRRTTVRACHSSGKTFALAIAALWWTARYADGVVLTTSPTYRQVRSQLWLEIHRIARQAKFPFPKAKLTELKLRGDDNFAMGFTATHGVNFQGFHGQHVLIIVDEAPGVDNEIYDAISGIMASGTVHLLIAGNPTIPSGPFYDSFHRERSLWNCIKLDAFETPNLQGLSFEELLQMDPSPDGPLDQNSDAHLVSRRWVYEQAKVWWHGDEQSSPEWMSRVRAEFPTDAQNALIKLAWLEQARDARLLTLAPALHGRLIAGVDVGAGRSETVVYITEASSRGYRIVGLGAWRGEETRGEVVAFLRPYFDRLVSVRVDAIGVGHGFAQHLRDEKYPVEMINVSQPCETVPRLRESDPAQRFVNQKAQFYQNLAEAFERGRIFGLTDALTFEQLAELRYEIDSRGRTKIEPKDRARMRGLVSPDRAEALMLAIGKEYKPHFFDALNPELAYDYYCDGDSVTEIAKHFKTTIDEVKTWIKSEASKRGSLAVCFWCYRRIDRVDAIQEGQWRFHRECHSKRNCGEPSPIAPGWSIATNGALVPN